MGDLIAPVIRVLLRYVAGLLLAKGMSSQSALLSDPDFQQVASYAGAMACASVSEGWYYIARKRGWSR